MMLPFCTQHYALTECCWWAYVIRFGCERKQNYLAERKKQVYNIFTLTKQERPCKGIDFAITCVYLVTAIFRHYNHVKIGVLCKREVRYTLLFNSPVSLLVVSYDLVHVIAIVKPGINNHGNLVGLMVATMLNIHWKPEMTKILNIHGHMSQFSGAD